MPLIVLTADVEDGAAWEQAYRGHGDLLKAAGIGTVRFTVGDDNHVVMCTDVPDVGAYVDFMQSDATQEAMKNDGVKRDTVKLHVLDKEFSG